MWPAEDTNDTHERYPAVFQRIQEREEERAAALNDVRRPTALFQLARVRVLGPVTDEEFARFATDTQEVVARFLGRNPA